MYNFFIVTFYHKFRLKISVLDANELKFGFDPKLLSVIYTSSYLFAFLLDAMSTNNKIFILPFHLEV